MYVNVADQCAGVLLPSGRMLPKVGMYAVEVVPCSPMHAHAASVIAPACEALKKWRCVAAAFSERLLQQFGVRFAGPISILRNWTFCLFYVMAELWGSVVVSLLFWGFANQVRRPARCIWQLSLYFSTTGSCLPACSLPAIGWACHIATQLSAPIEEQRPETTQRIFISYAGTWLKQAFGRLHSPNFPDCAQHHPHVLAQITTVDEAKTFYPLFGLGANVALIFSGRAVKYFSNVRAPLPTQFPMLFYTLQSRIKQRLVFGDDACGRRHDAAQYAWNRAQTTAGREDEQVARESVSVEQINKSCGVSHAQVRSRLPPGVDGWGYSLKGMMGMVVVGGLLITGTYYLLQRTVVPTCAAAALACMLGCITAMALSFRGSKMQPWLRYLTLRDGLILL